MPSLLLRNDGASHSETARRLLHVPSLQVRLRMFRGILAAWSKFSKFRRIAKGKHLESDRKHSQFVINKAWRSWRGAVAAKMEKWQAEGRDFNRRKLGGIARREGRVAIQRWALRYWVRRVCALQSSR